MMATGTRTLILAISGMMVLGGCGDEGPRNEGRKIKDAAIEGYITHEGSRRLEVSYLTSSGLRRVDTVVTERKDEVVIHIRLETLPGGRHFFDIRRDIITVMLQEPLRDRRVIDERGRLVQAGIPRTPRDELLD
jgi:hypothetical protein